MSNYTKGIYDLILNGRPGDTIEVKILERTTASPGTKSSYFGEEPWDDSDPICIFQVGDKKFKYQTSWDSWGWHEMVEGYLVEELPNE